jgi:hypothetical protein
MSTETIPIPDQQALLIPLSSYVRDVLGDLHYTPIGYDRAIAIFKITENYHTCVVQFTSFEDGKALKSPMLWNFAAFADSAERYRLAKIRAEQERVARRILEQNRETLKRAILKTLEVSDSQANVLSCKMIDKKQSFKIAWFGITLITTEQELR